MKSLEPGWYYPKPQGDVNEIYPNLFKVFKLLDNVFLIYSKNDGIIR